MIKQKHQFFSIDKKTVENSFQQIAKRDKLEEDKAKNIFF